MLDFKNKFVNKMKYHIAYLIIAGIAFVNFIILYIMIPRTKYPSYSYYVIYDTSDMWGNLTCYSDTQDLPELNVDLEKRNIFFLETSCRGDINSRQACSIESAARAHPKWDINVLFAGPIPNVTREKLQTFSNVKLSRINVSEFAKGSRSLLDVTLKGNQGLKGSNWPMIDASDVLRLITLQKFGGVYLDLDVIVVKSFEDLPRNWIVREDEHDVLNAILSVATDEVGKRFSDSAIRHSQMNYDSKEWGSLGPKLVTQVLKKICSTSLLVKMSASTCKGFEIFPRENFYPLRFWDWHKYFSSTNLVLREEYTHHLWNNASRTQKVRHDSLFAKLAERFCPTVFKMYGNSFGNEFHNKDWM